MGPISDPYYLNTGSPDGAHIGPILAQYGLTQTSPYGTHVIHCCKTQMGPGWAAYIGPIWVPIWDPYGSHIICLLGGCCPIRRLLGARAASSCRSIIILLLAEENEMRIGQQYQQFDHGATESKVWSFSCAKV